MNDYKGIDGCPYDFATLVQTVLPAHMARLNAAIQQARPASIYAQAGVGPKSLARQLGIPADFSGCYVLLDGGKPVYVGISRHVLVRLRQHLLSQDHFGASLAFAIARKRHGNLKGTRAQLMTPASEGAQTSGFRHAFDEAQAYLRGLSVGTIAIENPLELYVFEAYAAMALKTVEWNTFRTH